MPYPRYARLSREDVEAIVAYIRTLKPIDVHAAARELAVPAAADRADDADSRRRSGRCPPRRDRVAYGEYMTNAAACGDCHTPIDDRARRFPGREFAGGFEFKLPGGGVVRSANLTPDADTGIGTWTEEQFVDKFKALRARRAARAHRGRAAREHDDAVAVLRGHDARGSGAIYAYLRTHQADRESGEEAQLSGLVLVPGLVRVLWFARAGCGADGARALSDHETGAR